MDTVYWYCLRCGSLCDIGEDCQCPDETRPRMDDRPIDREAPDEFYADWADYTQEYD